MSDTKPEAATAAPAAEEKAPVAETESKPETKTESIPQNFLSMFGGAPKQKREETEQEKLDNEEARKEKEAEKEKKKAEEDEEAPESPEVHFEPLVQLTKIEAKSNEESEDQVFKMRAKLFRFDRESKSWKERGTGDVKLLKHKESGKTRLVMRREKTLKVCANHYIVPDMQLAANIGSDRSWVWSTAADVSEGEPESQTLAIRFANPENANLFKEAFLKAQKENEAVFVQSPST